MEAELDDGRHETRKTEVFEDGRTVGVSQKKPWLGLTGLVDLPYPTREGIDEQGAFHAGEVWRRADR